MHEGTIKPGDLNETMIRQTFDELNQGAAKGYGKEWTRLGSNAESDRSVLKIRQNIFRFSGAKTYAQLVDLNNKLTKEGQTVPFSEFKEEALKINEKYNLNYLQAEYQTARQAGHHARNWQQYQADKRLFPNLRYKTAGDRRVRDSHRALEGTIAPVDSPFWDKYYPPNGWRCRCYVVQTAERPTSDLPSDLPEVRPEFRLNVGKTDQVFSEKGDEGKKANPFFAILAGDHEAAAEVERQMVKTFREEVRTWAKTNLSGKSFSNGKLKDGFTLSNTDIKTITGKPHSDQFSRNNLLYDLAANFKAAKLIMEAPENKGRAQYIRWYYFKDVSGDFYYNVVEMADGHFVLHAITDRIQ